MSFPAIAWALKQPVGRASAKFLLIAMADCVNADSEELLCFPSIAHLSKVTDMDPKSVKANLVKLRELGFIEDSGDRKGKTGRVITYRLKSPEALPPQTTSDEPQSAQISASMSPNFPESPVAEMSPNFPSNEPNFPDQSAQISLVIGPNLGHGTSKEPVTEPVTEPKRKASSKFDPTRVQLPEWLPATTWSMWVKDRSDRRKPVTEAGAKLQLRALGDLRSQGHDPVLVIERAIEKGWQGLYGAKDGSTTAVSQSKPHDSGGEAARETLKAKVAALPPEWWKLAGFETECDAKLQRCWWTNYTEFRDGKRMSLSERAPA